MGLHLNAFAGQQEQGGGQERSGRPAAGRALAEVVAERVVSLEDSRAAGLEQQAANSELVKACAAQLTELLEILSELMNSHKFGSRFQKLEVREAASGDSAINVATNSTTCPPPLVPAKLQPSQGRFARLHVDSPSLPVPAGGSQVPADALPYTPSETGDSQGADNVQDIHPRQRPGPQHRV